jgi:hypothetical protein
MGLGELTWSKRSLDEMQCNQGELNDRAPLDAASLYQGYAVKMGFVLLYNIGFQ